MPGLLLNAANMTTEKLLPMVEATTTAIPISKTTTTIITNLSAGSHGQNKRPTIIIYPTGKHWIFTRNGLKLCIFVWYRRPIPAFFSVFLLISIFPTHFLSQRRYLKLYFQQKKGLCITWKRFFFWLLNFKKR